MSADYLTATALRLVGAAGVIRPRLSSRYEPWPAADAEVLAAPADVPRRARASAPPTVAPGEREAEGDAIVGIVHATSTAPAAIAAEVPPAPVGATARRLAAGGGLLAHVELRSETSRPSHPPFPAPDAEPHAPRAAPTVAADHISPAPAAAPPVGPIAPALRASALPRRAADATVYATAARTPPSPPPSRPIVEEAAAPTTVLTAPMHGATAPAHGVTAPAHGATAPSPSRRAAVAAESRAAEARSAEPMTVTAAVATTAPAGAPGAAPSTPATGVRRASDLGAPPARVVPVITTALTMPEQRERRRPSAVVERERHDGAHERPIQVTIGRIEIRATTPPPIAPRPRRPPTAMGLDEYLSRTSSRGAR